MPEKRQTPLQRLAITKLANLLLGFLLLISVCGVAFAFLASRANSLDLWLDWIFLGLMFLVFAVKIGQAIAKDIEILRTPGGARFTPRPPLQPTAAAITRFQGLNGPPAPRG